MTWPPAVCSFHFPSICSAEVTALWVNIFAPAFTALHAVAEAARNSPIGVAGQNMHWEREGAFTGEVSPGMLREAGAEYVLTRPIFDVSNFERFLKRISHAKLPIIAGLFPFDSVRNAEFMANEVPGVQVPDALMERMRASSGPDAAAAEGIAIAREIGALLRPMAQGVQVSTQSGQADAALAVLNGLR